MTPISPSEYEARIKALQAEIDRMRPVVDAAVQWSSTNYRNEEANDAMLDILSDACDDYESSGGKDGADDQSSI